MSGLEILTHLYNKRELKIQKKPKEISASLFLFLNLLTDHADPIVKHNHIVREVEFGESQVKSLVTVLVSARLDLFLEFPLLH